MKNARLPALICGLISISATVLFYILSVGNVFSIPMRWVSLMALLVAEIIGTLKAAFLNKEIITQASIFTSAAHLAVVFIASIIFVNFFSLALGTYILLNIMFLCAMAAIDLCILHLNKKVSENNKKLAQSRSVMEDCHFRARKLVIAYGQSEYKNDLLEISELIEFSDNSELTDDESAIMEKIGELETQLKEDKGNKDIISALISDIKELIHLRNLKMKSIKKGGY